MRLRHRFLLPPALAIIATGVLLQPTAAQYARPSATVQESEWENNRLRLRRIAVDPGASARPDAGVDRVLVYLTANQDGKMPEAEAVWQPAGSGDLQNRGALKLEALAIDLKPGSPGGGGGTPPEGMRSSSYGAELWPIIDNDRVLVTKHRYAPTTFVDPPHFHSDDMLVVYLQGGYTWPVLGGWGSYRVRRGEVDVVPANAMHTLGNAGSDPLEFLVIMPR